MFEWTDQELANIIWCEDGEADDHTVPSPEEIEKKPMPAAVDHDIKELNLEPASSRAAEEKITNSKTGSHDVRQDKDEGLHSTGDELQTDLSSFSASRSDQNCLAKKADQNHAAEIACNLLEDRELGEFIENSWANIGSFDDLDQIFSDDLVGRSPLAGADELWPASEDVICATEKSLALESTTLGLREAERTCRHFEVNADYLDDQNQSFFKKAEDFMTYAQQNLHSSMDLTRHNVGRATGILKAKEYWCEDQSKHGRQTGRSDYRLLQDAHGSRPAPSMCVQQSDSQIVPGSGQHHSSLLLDHQRKARDSRSSPYRHLSMPDLAPYSYGNCTHQYTAMPILQSADDEHKSVISGYEPSLGDLASVNNSTKGSAKPLTMTTQEKIEKLRWRHKLRAMLAIQKQQQQLIQQVPAANCSVMQRSFPQDQNVHLGGADVEFEQKTPCYDFHRFPVKLDGRPVEDAILRQLGAVISKLDIKIKLCIRDSLFRLAHSAHRRHSVSATSNTIRSRPYEFDATKKEISSHERCLRDPNAETETNHIDRAVARLLFHRPLMLPEKHSSSAESSTSTMAPSKQVAGVFSSLPVDFSAKSPEDVHNKSLHGSKPTCSFANAHQEVFKDIPKGETNAN